MAHPRTIIVRRSPEAQALRIETAFPFRRQLVGKGPKLTEVGWRILRIKEDAIFADLEAAIATITRPSVASRRSQTSGPLPMAGAANAITMSMSSMCRRVAGSTEVKLSSTSYRSKDARRVVVAGAQFADPVLFLQWITETFSEEPFKVEVGERDSVHEVLLRGRPPIRFEVAVPAHWEPEKVYEHLFRDAPDAVLLILTAAQRIPHVNAMAMRWVKRHLLRLGVTPVVIVNDAHGGNPAFPTFSAARVCEDHDVPWPCFETTIGSFSGPRLQWTTGAEETWNLLLAHLALSATNSPR